MTPDYLSIVHNQWYRDGFSSLILLDEVVYTIPISVTFPYFSPIFEISNEKLHQLIASGLTSYWYDKIINPKGLKIKPEDVGPQVLTMEHVTIGFIVCMWPLALSILVFIFEVLFFKLKIIVLRAKNRK